MNIQIRVTSILLCPRIVCNVFGLIPFSIHLVANVCLSMADMIAEETLGANESLGIANRKG